MSDNYYSGGAVSVLQYNIPRMKTIYHHSDHRFPYTEPILTKPQWIGCIGLSSLVGSVIARPLQHLDRFGFLFYSPSDMGISEKRPMVFETLLTSKWTKSYDGRTIPMHSLSIGAGLVAYQSAMGLLEPLTENRWIVRGYLAGGIGGLAFSSVMYPFEVLLSTARATRGTSAEMRGVADVFISAMRTNPGALKGVYKGYAPVALGSVLQHSFALGGYNFGKYDAVKKGHLCMFVYILTLQAIGYTLLYPFQQFKTMHRQANAAMKHSRVTYFELWNEIRKRYGRMYVYKGFFSENIILRHLPMAFAIFAMDFASRGYTEAAYPEHKKSDLEGQRLFKVAEDKVDKVRQLWQPTRNDFVARSIGNYQEPTGETKANLDRTQEAHDKRVKEGRNI